MFRDKNNRTPLEPLELTQKVIDRYLFSITIDGIELNVELAETSEEKARGLSERDGLAEDQGMLFIYDSPAFYSFWMKDMNFPIDIIWINEDFQVVDITKNFKTESFPQKVEPQDPAQYVIEVNAGWAESRRIHIRSPVSFNNIDAVGSAVQDTVDEEIFQDDESPDSIQEVGQLPQEPLPASNLLKILLDVPFTPQAPFGNWDDIKQQNACEEASVLMAMRWVEGKELSPKQAEEEIIAMSDFEKEKYGHFYDRSASDTAQLIKDYFDYQKVDVMTDISAEDIKVELAKGNVVIVPVNGQKLHNPYYTPPGPLEHMLVVIGYDTTTNEFITNDSGTRRGEKFRYNENVLDSALSDYPTGYHEPINEVNKTMIVIRPRQ